MSMPLLGEIFVAKGLVTEDEVEQALQLQRDEGGRFGDCLVAQIDFQLVVDHADREACMLAAA